MISQISTVRPLSQRRGAASTQRGSEQLEAVATLYRSLFEQAPVGYVEFDERGRLTHANATALQLLRLDAGFARNFPFNALVTKRQKPRFLEHLRRARSAEGPVSANLFLNVAGRGSISVELHTISLSERRYRTAIIETSQRKEEAFEIQRNAEELAAVLSTAAEPIIVIDAQGNITRANPTCREMLGYNCVGSSMIKLFRVLQPRKPDGKPFLFNELPSTRSLRGEVVRGLPMFTARHRMMIVSAAPLRSNKVVRGAVITLRDATERERLRARLESKRLLLEVILRELPEGIIACDAVGRIILSNPQTAEICRLAKPFKSISELLTFDTRSIDGKTVKKQDRPIYRALYRGESIKDAEMNVTRHDGSVFSLRVSAAPLRDVNGDIIGAVSVFQDITSRLAVRRKSAEERERLKLSLQAGEMGTFQWNPATGEEVWSEELERIYGIEHGKFVGEYGSFLSHVHPDDRELVRKANLKCVRNGGRRAVEFRVVRPDGKICWILSKAEMFKQPGRPTVMIGVNVDITSRKRVEEELRNHREHLEEIVTARTAELTLANTRLQKTEAQALRQRDFIRTLINSSIDGIFALDSEFRLTLWNPAMERLTGKTEAQVIGKVATVGFPVLEEAEAQRYLDMVLRGKNAIIKDKSYISAATGQPVFFEAYASPIRDKDERVLGALVIVRDATERKRLEQQISEAADAEQRRIGQDLHDGLGAQLTGISFMLKAVERSIIARDPDEAEKIAKISALVTESVVQTRQLAHGLNPVALEDNGLIAALEQLASRTQELFGIHCAFQSQAPVLINNNQVARNLYRIAQEAVHNAVKHAKPRRIVVSLNKTERDLCTLTVCDDGKGMRAEDRNGEGQGLRIMEYRAQAIGASLRVDRNKPKGTAISCIFTISESDAKRRKGAETDSKTPMST